MPSAVGRKSRTALIRLRWLGEVESRPFPRGKPSSSPRRRAWYSLMLGVVFFGVLQLLVAWPLDGLTPGWRDPEYALRVRMCRQRQAEYPGRPLIAVLGNSRTAMGVCPAAWEACLASQAADSAPMLFNFGLVGAGPMLQELTARRLLQDGVHPQVVLWEYWPPFLYQDEQWNEHQRVNIDRLSPRDLPWVDACYPPEKASPVRQRIWWQHLLPCWGARERILMQLVPDWLSPTRRIDWTWKHLDGWGWYPGLDAQILGAAGRERMTQQCQVIYQPLLARYCCAAETEASLRRGIRLLQNAGCIVLLLYLPESERFRRWYPPETEAQIQQQCRQLQAELGAEWLDTRLWMAETDFVDGFHLSRQGAAAFTQRLGQFVTERLQTPHR